MAQRCRPLSWIDYDKQARKPLQDPEPTTAIPGTPEKVIVLAQRVERGQRLFVKGDATFELK